MWSARRALPGAKRSGGEAERAAHLETGRRGETLAYWYLRAHGYTMVGRNLRLRADVGEIDMVGWDGGVLAFIEVKTRSSQDAVSPGEAIREHQQRRIARAAKVYLQRLKPREVTYRFDAVSVVWDQKRGYDLSLIKNAFQHAAAL